MIFISHSLNTVIVLRKILASKNNITIDCRKMNSLISVCVTDRGQGKFAKKVMYCENSLILKKIHFLVR